MSISLGSITLSGYTFLHRLEKGLGFVIPTVVKRVKEARKIKRLKYLASLIGFEGHVKIADVGANPLSYDAPYKPLLDAGLCEIVGFEPQEAAFLKLEAQKGQYETYLESAVGDGSVKTFYDYASDGLGSLFPLDKRISKNVSWMGTHCELNSKTEISTVRLDDVEEVGEIDFLKIDIQGGELLVLQNARNSLSKAVAIQIEMRFLQMYEGEPCFGEVDCELNNQGFEIHGIEGKLKHMRSMHSQTNELNGRAARQLLDHDFFYVKNLKCLDRLDTNQLKKLALISDGVFNSVDPAFLAIDLLIERNDIPKDVADKYRKSLPVEYLV